MLEKLLYLYFGCLYFENDVCLRSQDELITLRPSIPCFISSDTYQASTVEQQCRISP